MVHTRVKHFRTEGAFAGYGIQTELLRFDAKQCLFRATITNPKGEIVATGHAHEVITPKGVNATSMVENCETSAIGRALGILGIGIDNSLDTFETVARAIQMQDNGETIAEAISQKPTPAQKATTSGLIDAFDAVPVANAQTAEAISKAIKEGKSFEAIAVDMLAGVEIEKTWWPVLRDTIGKEATTSIYNIVTNG